MNENLKFKHQETYNELEPLFCVKDIVEIGEKSHNMLLKAKVNMIIYQWLRRGVIELHEKGDGILNNMYMKIIPMKGTDINGTGVLLKQTFIVTDNRGFVVAFEDELDAYKFAAMKNEEIDALTYHVVKSSITPSSKYVNKKNEIIRKLDTKLVDCDLSVRTLNILNHAEIETIGELMTFDRDKLAYFRNCGQKTIDEIDKFIVKVDLDGIDIIGEILQ